MLVLHAPSAKTALKDTVFVRFGLHRSTQIHESWRRKIPKQKPSRTAASSAVLIPYNCDSGGLLVTIKLLPPKILITAPPEAKVKAPSVGAFTSKPLLLVGSYSNYRLSLRRATLPRPRTPLASSKILLGSGTVP